VAEERSREKDARKRNLLKWGMECSTGLLVGGITFSLSLMVSGSALHLEVFIAFWALLFALLIAVIFLLYLSDTSEGGATRKRSGRFWFMRLSTSMALFCAVGLIIAPSGHWPVKAYSPWWWILIGGGLAAALTGQMLRRGFDLWLFRLKLS
jgi:hypothetical protein